MQLRKYGQRIHYKVDGKWRQIDTTLVEDDNAAESTNPFGKALGSVKGKVQNLNTYKVKSNEWQAKFAASDDGVGMVRIEADGTKVSFSPKDANSVTPELTKKDGIQTVTYTDLWDGVDVRYTIKSDVLKEDIILTSAQAKTDYSFKVNGAELTATKDGGFTVAHSKNTIAPLSVIAKQRGLIDGSPATQTYQDGTFKISLDKNWVKSLPKDEFPVDIDPTWNHGTPVVDYNYTTYKSDGTSKTSSQSYMNAGTLYDTSWKNWRTVYYVNFNELMGKQLVDANMILYQANGYVGNRYFFINHANCYGYNCVDTGAPSNYGLINSAGSINMKDLLQSRINVGDWGASFILRG
jgi:large repetitive protein